jgi:hypothetical protein
MNQLSVVVRESEQTREIIQGGKFDLPLRIIDKKSLVPYDLTGINQLCAFFINRDGTTLVLDVGAGVIINNATRGEINLNLTAAQTAFLAITDHETFEIAIYFGADPIRVQEMDFYSVVASQFTTSGHGTTGPLLTPYGSPTNPVIVTAAGGITANPVSGQIIFVASNGGDVLVTADPQISAGQAAGQELVLVGTSDTDFIRLSDGRGLSLNGEISLGVNSAIILAWDGQVWMEVSRR